MQRAQAGADLIAPATDGAADNITCIVADVARQPETLPAKTAGKTAGETAWTAGTSDAIL